MFENFDDDEYLPSTPNLRTGSRRAETRSRTRELNARNSALLLTPPPALANNVAPSFTPPRTVNRYGKRRNRMRVSNTPEYLETDFLGAFHASTMAATLTPIVSSVDDTVTYLATVSEATPVPLMSPQGGPTTGPQPDSITSSPSNAAPVTAPTGGTIDNAEGAIPLTPDGVPLSDREMIAFISDGMNTMINKIRLLEGKVARKDEQISEKDALLAKVCCLKEYVVCILTQYFYQIAEARDESMICPILGVPAENIYMCVLFPSHLAP